MPTLHALFVAINQYPPDVRSLRGCINDMKDFQHFLEDYCKKTGMAFRSKVLTDSYATRSNVIDGFDHYKASLDGDSCVFYYSGHGSRLLAPEAIVDLKPGGVVESLVCYDSLEVGKDLLDKELSYLLWKAGLDEKGKTKKVPFLVVTDCCHSGAATRVDGMTERQYIPSKVHRYTHPIEEFLGLDEYLVNSEKKYSPPRGRYVHLSACRREETAKELDVGIGQRGMFTYALVSALQNYGYFMSYSELISRVQVRVRNQFGEHSPQNPQLDAPLPEEKRCLFLTGIPIEGKEPCVIAYDFNKYSDEGLGWIVNRGAIHGIPKGDGSFKTKLELLGENKVVSVSEVRPECSAIAGMESYASDEHKKRSFAAKIIQYGVEDLLLSIGKYADSQGIMMLKAAYAERPSDLFTISTDPTDSEFLIQAKEAIELNGKRMEGPFYYLSGPFEELPLFEPSKGFSEESAFSFLKRLENVAHWMQALELRNPDTSISDDEIKIELFESTEPWNQGNDTPVKLVKWDNPPTFKYQKFKGNWHAPIIQFKVTNTGRRPLWISLLYMGDDFSISNRFLQLELLNPGENAKASELCKNQTYYSIPIRIMDKQLESGVFFIHEYMKLFICTDQFSTSPYLQDGLPHFVMKADLRAGGRERGEIQLRDWKCVEIPVRVEHPDEKRKRMEESIENRDH